MTIRYTYSANKRAINLNTLRKLNTIEFFLPQQRWIYGKGSPRQARKPRIVWCTQAQPFFQVKTVELSENMTYEQIYASR